MQKKHSNEKRTIMNHPVVTRYPGNPILTADDIPFEANLIFNAGVVKYHGRYIMLFGWLTATTVFTGNPNRSRS